MVMPVVMVQLQNLNSISVSISCKTDAGEV